MRHFIKGLAAFIGKKIKASAIMDAKLEFSDAQVISKDTFVQSTDVINFGDSDVGAAAGRGTPVYLIVTVSTAFNGPAGGTFNVILQTSADGTTWASKIRFYAPTASNLATVGVSIVKVALPAHDLAQYLSLTYENGALVSGAVDAWLALEAPTGPEDTVEGGWTA